MSYVVVDHVHDRSAKLYRMVVGIPIVERVLTEDNGGEVEEIVAGYADLRDYVFADDDARWAGKDDEQVAAEQRTEVAAKLAAVDAAVDAAPAPAPDSLPGVGGTL
jgi:hypothetical protein